MNELSSTHLHPAVILRVLLHRLRECGRYPALDRHACIDQRSHKDHVEKLINRFYISGIVFKSCIDYIIENCKLL